MYRIRVPGKGASSVSFPIVPTELGDIPIQVIQSITVKIVIFPSWILEKCNSWRYIFNYCDCHLVIYELNRTYDFTVVNRRFLFL